MNEVLHTDFIKIDPAYRDVLAACRLTCVQDVLDRLGDRVAAWSRTTDSVYVQCPGGRPGLYLKRYFYRSWRQRLRGAFRGTFFGKHRAQAEARALHAMRRRGIPAVRPVAWGVRRVAHFVTASFLITEEAPDTRNLTGFAQAVNHGLIPLEPARRHTVTHALAQQILHMHETGFFHGQLFWRNILIRFGLGGEADFFFLDARPRFPFRKGKSISSWRRAELARLAASAWPFTTRTDRVRFARAYFGVTRLGPAEKSFIAEISARARRFRRHEAQRIKMNALFDAWNRELERVPQRELAAIPVLRPVEAP